MKRMTTYEDGKAVVRGDSIYFCRGVPDEDGFHGYAIERLAAYEDTGLEPEAVEACKVALMGKSLAEITEFDGVALERLKELATMDRRGQITVANWIDPKNRLPNPFQPVLVARMRQSDKSLRVEQGEKELGPWWRVYGTRVKSVVAWMPLPEPPKETP